MIPHSLRRGILSEDLKIRPLKITLRMFMYGLDAKIIEILSGFIRN